MYDYSNLKEKPNNTCIVCGSDKQKKIGIRGNREYFGSDKSVTPHCVTNVVECKNCGFIYINPTFQGIDDVESIYYSSIDLYVYNLKKSVEDMFQKRVDIISQYSSGKHGLDVGPGKGEFLNQLSKNGYIAEGIEPSTNFCEFASKTFNLKMHNLTLDNFITENKYDFISSLHSLEHMNNPHLFFKSAHSLLNENGILYIEVPNTNAAIVRIIEFIYKIIGLGWSSRLCPLHQPFHKHGYNLKSLSYILKANNFELINTLTLTGTDRGYTEYSGLKGIISRLKYFMTEFIEIFGQKECLVVLAKKKKAIY